MVSLGIKGACFKGCASKSGRIVEGPLFKDGDNYLIQSGEKNFLVDEESIGMYTGAVDIKGRKIYVNDIIKCKNYFSGKPAVYTVCIAGEPYYNVRLKDDEGLWSDFRDNEKYEVIGNIYQKKYRSQLEKKDNL
jgi:hypothetical protein